MQVHHSDTTPMMQAPGQVVVVVQGPQLDPSRLRATLIPSSGQPAGFLRHIAYGHPKIKNLFCIRSLMCRCWECGFCSLVHQTMKESTYIKVYDDRLEWNEPRNFGAPINRPGCFNYCNWTCVQSDSVNTVHYDRAIVANAAKAENFCRPCCTPSGATCSHFELFPDCCGIFGETVVIYATTKGCCYGCCQCTPCCKCCECAVMSQGADLHGSPFEQWTATFGAGCAPPHRLIRAVDNAEALAIAINSAVKSSKTPNVVLGVPPAHQQMF